MKHLLLSTTLFALGLGACSDLPTASQPASNASGETVTAESKSAPDKSTVMEIAWEELLPEGEEERLAELYREQATQVNLIGEGAAGDIAQQIGSFSTVPGLDGQRVRLPGYTVPFDYGVDAEITEFLLVPYFGACLHAPPPPPNQTIFITTDKAIKLADLAQAVWVEGTLRATRQETALAAAAYTIEMDSIEDY